MTDPKVTSSETTPGSPDTQLEPGQAPGGIAPPSRAHQVLRDILGGSAMISVLAVLLAFVAGGILIALTDKDVQTADTLLSALGATDDEVDRARGLAARKVAWGLNYYRDSLPDFAATSSEEREAAQQEAAAVTRTIVFDAGLLPAIEVDIALRSTPARHQPG